MPQWEHQVRRVNSCFFWLASMEYLLRVKISNNSSSSKDDFWIFGGLLQEYVKGKWKGVPKDKEIVSAHNIIVFRKALQRSLLSLLWILIFLSETITVTPSWTPCLVSPSIPFSSAQRLYDWWLWLLPHRHLFFFFLMPWTNRKKLHQWSLFFKNSVFPPRKIHQTGYPKFQQIHWLFY